jgi:hypothetical protein
MMAEQEYFYEPVGDELSYETALLQASQAIDLAGVLAWERRDTNQLLEVAGTWAKMADFLVALGDMQEKKDLDKKPERDFKTGFSLADKEENDGDEDQD